MSTMGDNAHQVARFMAIWPNAVGEGVGKKRGDHQSVEALGSPFFG